MELFRKAKTVRLRSHHDKYLLADSDKESVSQDRNGSNCKAKWEVEFEEDDKVLRLKSCYGKYLTASDHNKLLGTAGQKVLQTVPGKLDSSVEWEPIREGVQVRLKTRYGHFLRANGGLPPWRNSVTHDIPHRRRDWILWDVDVVEVKEQPPAKPEVSGLEPSSLENDQIKFLELRRQESSDSLEACETPMKNEGRMIYYQVAINEEGDVEEGKDEESFTFKAQSADELKETLKEETGMKDISVCSRNPLNGKLYPLRLQLPPNNADMHVVVVPGSASLL